MYMKYICGGVCWIVVWLQLETLRLCPYTAVTSFLTSRLGTRLREAKKGLGMKLRDMG